MRRVSLPAWNEDQVLPPGIWPTDLDGIRERFVLDVPNQNERELLFNALTLYLMWVRPLVGPATVWVDGGFSMRKAAPPNDVDIVIFPDDWGHIEGLDEEHGKRLLSSLTHQGVVSDVSKGGVIPRLQPMAGMLDAFLGRERDREVWRDTWSNVKLDGVLIDGMSKGFAEVRI